MIETAEQEKHRVALSSVLAAIFLTTIKIIVGLLTNSLGILSEAAHSGLDLIAAGVTYFAVRISDQPPDRVHHYGHGKVENLSAFIETLLLLATCAWIVYEAISRLIEPVQVEATLWSFAVMGTSIIVDISRSRALMRVAKKHNSQALEADALHFSTDVWSSTVVILGLLTLRLAPWLESSFGIPVEWLYRADAIAALGVSAIVVYVSYQLGRKTINVLLDAAEKDAVKKIEDAVSNIQGVQSIKRLRVRHSGAETFVDLTLEVPRTATFEESHLLTMQVEKTIEEIIPRSDVMVHIDPAVKDRHSLIETVRSIASQQGLRVHGFRAHDVLGNLTLQMHVEIPERMSLNQAHNLVSILEDKLYLQIPGLKDVITHLEPIGDDEVKRPAIQISSEELQIAIQALATEFPGICDCHNIKIHSDGHELSVTFHCHVEQEMTVHQAHQLTIELESQLRRLHPELGRVVIHTEPYFDTPESLESSVDIQNGDAEQSSPNAE
jgi:cation diffusion facilitator family transporter